MILAGCLEPADGLPEGAWLRVGTRVYDEPALVEISSELGAWAQLRFRGPEGLRSLLTALEGVELMAAAARQRGLDRDPRVQWACFEEIARQHLAAELERRAPFAEVLADEPALAARIAADPGRWQRPETRTFAGVAVDSYDEALALLARARSDDLALEALGQVAQTLPQVRDDASHPGFHPLLFDEGLAVGDWLAAPVLLPRTILIGKLIARTEPALPSLDDDGVRERVAREEWAERAGRVAAEYLDELARRYPERP